MVLESYSFFMICSHCHLTWCPLTTEIVASQCPSSRDAVLMTPYIIPVILVCLKLVTRVSIAMKHIYKDTAK